MRNNKNVIFAHRKENITCEAYFAITLFKSEGVMADLLPCHNSLISSPYLHARIPS